MWKNKEDWENTGEQEQDCDKELLGCIKKVIILTIKPIIPPLILYSQTTPHVKSSHSCKTAPNYGIYWFVLNLNKTTFFSNFLNYISLIGGHHLHHSSIISYLWWIMSWFNWLSRIFSCCFNKPSNLLPRMEATFFINSSNCSGSYSITTFLICCY